MLFLKCHTRFILMHGLILNLSVYQEGPLYRHWPTYSFHWGEISTLGHDATEDQNSWNLPVSEWREVSCSFWCSQVWLLSKHLSSSPKVSLPLMAVAIAQVVWKQPERLKCRICETLLMLKRPWNLPITSQGVLLVMQLQAWDSFSLAVTRYCDSALQSAGLQSASVPAVSAEKTQEQPGIAKLIFCKLNYVSPLWILIPLLYSK